MGKKYCVPNGTLCSVCMPVFYRYNIPKGMYRTARHCGLDPQSPCKKRCIPKGMPAHKRHYMDNATVENMNNLKKSALILSICVICALNTVTAQSSVSNIRVEQSDEQFVIMYDLAHDATIEVHVSVDGGATFRGPLQHVLGSVGKDVPEGRDKVVIWNALREFGDIDYPNAVIKVVANAAPAIKTGQIYSFRSVVYSKNPFAHLADRSELFRNNTVFQPVEVQLELNRLFIYMSKNERKEHAAIMAQNGLNILRKKDIRSLMQNNTEALHLYNTGKRKQNNGSWLAFFGFCSFVGGFVPLGIGIDNEEEGDKLILGGVGLIGAGIASMTVGGIMSKRGKNDMGNAIKLYNAGLSSNQTTMELHFGVTGRGVGLALKF